MRCRCDWTSPVACLRVGLEGRHGFGRWAFSFECGLALEFSYKFLSWEVAAYFYFREFRKGSLS